MRGWVYIEHPVKDFAEVMLVPTQEQLFGTNDFDWIACGKRIIKIVRWVI